jgi:GNAT superfamily N-acetyltransferase
MTRVIRMAEARDAETLARHRAEMWLAMGDMRPEAYDKMREQSLAYFKEEVRKGYVGWVVEEQNGESYHIIGGGGLLLRRISPFPDDQGMVCNSEKQAHVLNVFVEKEYRGAGLARLIMTTILDWCQQEDIKSITLNASAEGKPLYEKLGFVDVQNFMRVKKQ